MAEETTFNITPTYYHVVEGALCAAGDLDLSVEFHNESDKDNHVTQISVKEGRESLAPKVQSALRPFFEK